MRKYFCCLAAGIAGLGQLKQIKVLNHGMHINNEKEKEGIDDTYSEKEQCPNVSRIISAKYQISGKECISNHPFKFQVIRFIFLATLSECI